MCNKYLYKCAMCMYVCVLCECVLRACMCECFVGGVCSTCAREQGLVYGSVPVCSPDKENRGGGFWDFF